MPLVAARINWFRGEAPVEKTGRGRVPALQSNTLSVWPSVNARTFDNLTLYRCLCRKLRFGLLVMQTADQGLGHDPSDPLREWRILGQGAVPVLRDNGVGRKWTNAFGSLECSISRARILPPWDRVS